MEIVEIHINGIENIGNDDQAGKSFYIFMQIYWFIHKKFLYVEIKIEKDTVIVVAEVVPIVLIENAFIIESRHLKSVVVAKEIVMMSVVVNIGEVDPRITKNDVKGIIGNIRHQTSLVPITVIARIVMKGKKCWHVELEKKNYFKKMCRYSNDDTRRNETPNNKVIVRGLAPHLTEADVSLFWFLRFEI